MSIKLLVTTGTLARVFSLVWTEATPFVKARLIAAVALITTASALTALGPVALKLIVDRFTAAPASHSLSVVILVSLYVLSQWLARAVGEIRGLIYARAERRMMRTLSERLFAHILRLPLRFHLNRQTGALTQCLTNGLQGYQLVLHTLVFSILPIGTELGTIVLVLTRLHESAFLGLFCAAIVCYSVAFTFAARNTMRAARNASAAQIEAYGTMTDSLLNHETVKYFAAEEIVQKKVGGALTRTESEWVRFYHQFAMNGLLVATIYAAFLGATILYAAREVQAGLVSLGTFVLINTYMLQIVRPVEMLGYAVQSLSQGTAYLEKMLDIFHHQAEDLGYAPVPLHNIPARLEFENVSVSYRADRNVLNGVSFKLPAGRTLGIVGPSGSGKSTVVRLLTRLLEPDTGAVLLDGTPLYEVPLSQLRNWIAVVPQDTVLFDDTIGYNIAFGRPGSTQEDIEQAARVAHLHDFILSLPEGYDTTVGERGVKLSGGERQRVSIARAALKRPRIYVFDEATSSLDSRTEREILCNLEEIARHSTALVIAHRLSTVVHADEILVLESGAAVERGPHACLLRLGKRYAALWAAQHQSVNPGSGVSIG
jgi:ABC-type transport system involved in Fe-S cluster assembly fused permease/ATPase subunit